MPTDAKQIWKCSACNTHRQWGFGTPEDTLETFPLFCNTCQQARKHSYVGTTHETAKEIAARARPQLVGVKTNSQIAHETWQTFIEREAEKAEGEARLAASAPLKDKQAAMRKRHNAPMSSSPRAVNPSDKV